MLCICKVSYCKLYSPPRLAMLYAGCVNLKNLPNLNFNKMMMMIMKTILLIATKEILFLFFIVIL